MLIEVVVAEVGIEVEVEHLSSAKEKESFSPIEVDLVMDGVKENVKLIVVAILATNLIALIAETWTGLLIENQEIENMIFGKGTHRLVEVSSSTGSLHLELYPQ